LLAPDHSRSNRPRAAAAVSAAAFAAWLGLGGCAGVHRPAGAPGAGGTGAAGGRRPCVDLDGDGYGSGCALGWDCDDHDPAVQRCTGGGIGDPDPHWVPAADGGAPDVFVPPAVETPTCPAGSRRVHATASPAAV